MKLDTALTLLAAIILLVLSSLFGAYIYNQVEAYYEHQTSMYTGYNSPYLFHAPRASNAFTDDGRWIRVFYPNDTKRITIGDSYNVFWEYKEIGSFRIYLQQKDNPSELLDIVGVVYQDEPPSQKMRKGIYSWVAGQLSSGDFVEPSGGWKLVVADADDPSVVFDVSDKFFALVEDKE